MKYCVVLSAVLALALAAPLQAGGQIKIPGSSSSSVIASTVEFLSWSKHSQIDSYELQPDGTYQLVTLDGNEDVLESTKVNLPAAFGRVDQVPSNYIRNFIASY